MFVTIRTANGCDDRREMSPTHGRARYPRAAKRPSHPPLTFIVVVLIVAFAVIAACEDSPRDESTSSAKSAPPEMPFTVEGHGDFVSDNFILEPSKYRATINVSGNSDQSGTPKSFIVTLFTAALGRPSVLADEATASGNWQTTTTVLDRQHFYLDIVAAGEWTVTFQPA